MAHSVTIYIFSVVDFTQAKEAIAITSDGYIVAYSTYINEDNISLLFGARGQSTAFHSAYDMSCPEGWSLQFVDRTKLKAHKEAQEALKCLVYKRKDLEEDSQQ